MSIPFESSYLHQSEEPMYLRSEACNDDEPLLPIFSMSFWFYLWPFPGEWSPVGRWRGFDAGSVGASEVGEWLAVDWVYGAFIP